MRLRIQKKSRYMQSWLLRNPWTRPISIFNLAAIRIQALLRGALVRRLGARHWRERLVARPKKVLRSQLDKYLACLDTYQSRRKEKPAWLEQGFSAWCCVRVQSWWRMVCRRRRYLNSCRAICVISVIVIQDAMRTLVAQSRERERLAMPVYSPDEAATMIQLKWRSCSNRRIYFYFRELILFKLKGAPEDLLRSIVPEECNAMDKAAGVHVRFRLGGTVFPPRIFFKIFTHKAVCDVNAFAPRNYLVEKKPDDFHNNNKKLRATKKDLTAHPLNQTENIRVGASYFGTIIQTSNDSGKGWYKRVENNPWRPISKNIVEELTMEPEEREKNHEKAPEAFHFSRLRRRQDLERRKKKKKRDWMRKAYLLSASDPESFDAYNNMKAREARLYNNGTQLPPLDQGSQFGSETDGPAHIFEGGSGSAIARDDPITPVYRDDPKSEEELLRWSMALDFDDYANEWAALATSLPSDITYQESVSASRVELNSMRRR